MQKEVYYQQISKSGSSHDVKYIRTKYISEELINTWKEMLASGTKRKDICEQYKISMPTLRKYCGAKFQLQKPEKSIKEELPGLLAAENQLQTNN